MFKGHFQVKPAPSVPIRREAKGHSALLLGLEQGTPAHLQRGQKGLAGPTKGGAKGVGVVLVMGAAAFEK